jgi:hypothetical protein
MRRSVVDEVFEAHEAQRLEQATSGLKSWTADKLQRGWVVPGFRERLIDFYEAVARARAVPGRTLEKLLDPDGPLAVGNDPFVSRAWDTLIAYFHAHQEKLLALYPRMGESLRTTDENGLISHFLNKASKQDLAASALQKVGVRTGRGWANKQLASWATRG